ncbi:3-hydroxyacyl-CoA dehydrogenase NAD-binding domain-containing protein [Paracoccus sp. (in: a-proteobacteria)]|uniref:3-hydroxyacyl-CoA dehydrogenase NAD-binding domain-containing protein n=1 Tax=Paracoccus sp. TaxID=267 RepID=UPI003340EA00
MSENPVRILIPEGRTLKAAEAQELGMIDALADDPLSAARTMALPDRLATAMLPEPATDPDAVAAARDAVAKRRPHQIAPQTAIDLVEAAACLPLTEALRIERAAFLDLRTNDQAAALRHLFFAERAAMAQGREDGADIARAVVVGGGNMGTGIAYALAQVGIMVTLLETDRKGVDRARANVAALYDQAVKRGKTSAADARAALSTRHSFHIGYEHLPPADIAIEAVFEDMEVKRHVFAALDAALPDNAILATNTSYLNVNRIAETVRNPLRFLGLHFFSPAHLMKLVEVVCADTTSPATLASVMRLAARLKKVPVLAGVCDGFIGNRILTRYRQTCDIMLIEGALPAQVDAAMRGFGMAMGPYEVQDLSGLDIAYANRKRMGWKDKPGFRYISIADCVVEETGRLGRKTSAGWYDYTDGKPTPSPRINGIVTRESARAGITRRTFTDEEIVDRVAAAIVEEGFRILQEGIAEKSANIDLVLVHGYGFPRWRGGPMHWAGRKGLSTILHHIEELAAEDPLSWGAPALLRQAVAEGKTPEELEPQDLRNNRLEQNR